MSKSKNILRDLLASRPVRTPLEFGIQENIRLIAISNEVKKRDGEVIQRNTYMTFAKFDKDNKVMAQSEFNYFNLRHDSDYTGANLATQASQLKNIISVVNPDGVDKFNPTKGYESMDEINDDMKTKSGCKKLMDSMYKSFERALGDSVGHDSPLMRLKVVVDYKTGKYTQLPDDSRIVESMDDEVSLKITNKEKRNKEKATLITKVSADSAGNSPGVATSKAAIIDI